MAVLLPEGAAARVHFPYLVSLEQEILGRDDPIVILESDVETNVEASAIVREEVDYWAAGLLAQ